MITLEQYLEIYPLTLITYKCKKDCDYVMDLFNLGRTPSSFTNDFDTIRLSVTGEALKCKFDIEETGIDESKHYAVGYLEWYKYNIESADKYIISIEEFKNRINNLNSNYHIDNVLLNI